MQQPAPEHVAQDSAEAASFGEELRQWAAQTAEVFSLRIFFTELLGHTLFSLLGPLSYPVLFVLYGSVHGLLNRSFLPNPGRADVFLVVVWVCWATSLTALALWLVYQPQDVLIVELKLVLVSVYFKNATISVKYAFMGLDRWAALATPRRIDSQREDFLLNWFFMLKDTINRQAEMAFIGVLGTREQRASLSLKFLGWPSELGAVDAYRRRLDKSARALHLGQTLSSKHLKTAAAEGPKPEEPEEEEEEEDARVFLAAVEGKSVPLEDLFRYLMRATLRKEAAVMPKPPLFAAWIAIVMVLVFMPSFLRLSAGRGFLGGSWQSSIIIVCLWPSALSGYMSTIMFLCTGIKDFWRRDTLLRSCSALLSLDQCYRTGCPAETQRLPLLDLDDIRTVEALRKLRQLCLEWGVGFFQRVRGFAVVCFVMTLLIIGDVLSCMLNEAYLESNDLTLAYLLLAGLVATLFLGYVVVMCILGQDINDAAGRDVLLLQRQRLLLTYRRYELASADSDSSEKPTDNTEAAVDYIDMVCSSIEAEHAEWPISLLGLYCGYSLLTSLYCIPLLTATTVFEFCTGEHGQRCLRLL